MKKILKILLIVIVVLFVLFLVGAFLFPSRVNVSESIVIKAKWHAWSDIDSDMECAALVDGYAKSNKIVNVSKSYEGKAVVLDWYGAYDSSPEGWKKIDEFIAANGLVKNGIPWDEYVTDPKMEPDTAKWLTKLYQPVK
jgi:effector-binding domain-containing protein